MPRSSTFLSLRRRFQQNQEDCTITVLELLPTLAESVLESLPAEKIAEEIQQKKVQRSGKGAGTSDVAPSNLSSGTPSTVDEDGKSLSSFQSESYVHASQVGGSRSGVEEPKTPKNKAQLWDELKISCMSDRSVPNLDTDEFQQLQDVLLCYTLFPS